MDCSTAVYTTIYTLLPPIEINAEVKVSARSWKNTISSENKWENRFPSNINCLMSTISSGMYIEGENRKFNCEIDIYVSINTF